MFIKFYAPFFYSYSTRFKSSIKLASWGFIYLLPLLFLSFCYFDHYGLLVSIINITLIYTVYELGYIFNDVYTIKKEKDPTLRLGKKELHYCERNIYKIVAFRFAVVGLLLYLLELVNFDSTYIFCVLLLIVLVYFIYNTIRNRFNLLLHFFLVNLRYTAVVVPFLPLSSAFLVVFLFPFINLLERCSESRFELVFFQRFILSNKTNGRYIYYSILTVLLAFVYPLSDPLFITSLYYLCYRFFSLKIVGK